MERQQTLALPLKKSLRTSNESIFPSLHPFGPFYRQRTLLQKRTSEMLDNEPECFEPVKRARTVPQPVKSLASSQFKKQELTNNFLNFFQYSQAANQGLGNDLELGLADIWNNIMGASFTENLQTTLMVEIMRQHIELLAQQPSQLTNLGSERNYSLKVKDLKNKFVVSDSSTNDSETDEENQPKGNKEEELHNDVSIIIAPLHQRQWNEVNTVQQVSAEEKGHISQGCLDENLMLVEPVPVKVVEDDGLMPGFTDKLNSPVVVNESVQAVLPSFGIGIKSEGNKKVLKPIWEAEDEKIGKAQTLIDSLKEVLGFEVTNEEKAIKMLRDNGFVVEKCMEIVGKQKTKHKAEFKIKKVSLKKYR